MTEKPLWDRDYEVKAETDEWLEWWRAEMREIYEDEASRGTRTSQLGGVFLSGA